MTETDNLILACLGVFASYYCPGMTGPWPREFRVITKFNFSVSMTQLITYESQPASVTTHLSMQPEGSTSQPNCRHELTHITVKTVCRPLSALRVFHMGGWYRNKTCRYLCLCVWVMIGGDVQWQWVVFNARREAKTKGA